MASGMVSRWPVVVETTIAPGECAAGGALTRAGLERLFVAAWADYLERCPVLAGAAGAIELVGEQQQGACAPGDTVDVGIGATELFAARLHVGMRVRGGASGLAVEASWSVGVAAVTRAIRDELIALAHGAAYVL